MKKIIYFFTLIAIVLSLVTERRTQASEAFKIKGKLHKFATLANDRGMISLECKNSKCQAKRSLENLSLKKAKPFFVENANPGAVICLTQTSGKIVMGKARKGYQSFCAFPDESMIDSGSLLEYASKNDLKNDLKKK